MSRVRVYFVAFLFSLLTFSTEAASLYPLPTQRQEAQFQHLLKSLRCLVCQNQDLADSNAGLANDLRQQVYDMVRRGDSDTEIIRYLTDRYGDFILFDPPVKGVTVLLWCGPALFLLLGLFIFWRNCLRVSHEH
jgi:cytochrome c-type biogenesis protein CcmH